MLLPIGIVGADRRAFELRANVDATTGASISERLVEFAEEGERCRHRHLNIIGSVVKAGVKSWIYTPKSKPLAATRDASPSTRDASPSTRDGVARA